MRRVVQRIGMDHFSNVLWGGPSYYCIIIIEIFGQTGENRIHRCWKAVPKGLSEENNQHREFLEQSLFFSFFRRTQKCIVSSRKKKFNFRYPCYTN